MFAFAIIQPRPDRRPPVLVRLVLTAPRAVLMGLVLGVAMGLGPTLAPPLAP